MVLLGARGTRGGGGHDGYGLRSMGITNQILIVAAVLTPSSCAFLYQHFFDRNAVSGKSQLHVKRLSRYSSKDSMQVETRQAPEPPSMTNFWHQAHAQLLDRSLRQLTGTALLPRPNASPAECASLATNEGFVVVSTLCLLRLVAWFLG